MLQFICRGSSDGHRYCRSMWDAEAADSEFALELSKANNNSDFIQKLCHASSVAGPKANKRTATDSTPRNQAKRPRLSLDASVVEATDEMSHSDIKEKYIGNNLDNLNLLFISLSTFVSA